MGFQGASSWQTREQAVTQYDTLVAGSIMQNDGQISSHISRLKASYQPKLKEWDHPDARIKYSWVL